ncbi:UDP-N-acetylmuramoyl-L-alanyl-D-glutamate--2,6-diaminopimelate ligase [Halalkalibacterium halodurans]|uniref:UDP-N-acetylmuramoyl-L-alanyl-D-glutamate--2,6-diaminopimelate ligase n=3 Tax=Halalkalibacterium halodurans TaxID=86665 RepID=A0A0M0KIK8_ALKHA|nr:UDP-N-acetylmuramoyl-L-alanyl-D-glutamate--2,6-diaminopimelate ligase [Halalkalibacterium halodurans]TPE69179.1 UDP-N-acetylmuramoyl-L-alanyl-D-glutamate--2,6-diaminopimelate ligase [Halalkalibacterium halodurans]
MVKLVSLLDSLYGYKMIHEGNPDIHSIHMDSREVVEGGLFFCIKGYTVDGHDYAQQAVSNGAVAVVSERPLELSVPVVVVRDSRRAMAQVATKFYGEPTNDLQLIGVTGTNGKTTITHLIEKIMQDQGKMTGLIGTMYTKIGHELRETKNTTPESLVLQRTFADMKKSGVTTAMMEVSSHALQSGRVRGCDFDVAVFSNLTPDHLDYHGTMERYKFAKGLLFAQLGNTYRGKVAVLNADDPASADFAEMTIAQVVTYGIENEADFQAENVRITSTGTTFELAAFEERMEISIRLIGKFSVYNVLAAAAAAYVSGVPLQEIKKSLEEVKGVAGRFETVKHDQPFTVIVDYAHTPDSLENVLKTVSELAKGDVRVVVGCGGDRDKTKRPVMAEIATTFADQAIFTSDNPRSEEPMDILHDMEQGAKGDSYLMIEDRKEAIFKAIELAKEDDIIVIAGKGHETYQQFRDRTIDFDDRIVAQQAIKERWT